MITGKIKQIETMGLHDGPGVRVVIFMQGCPLRCLYCHNPEMWTMNEGTSYTPEEIYQLILRYKPYFGDDGGVTFSGGEPLMQPEFLCACLKLCKENRINTCLDTSGVGDIKYNEEILSYVDLVIYDIKAIDDDKYKHITDGSIATTETFLSLCQKLNKKLWLRSVIVPGINDNDEYISKLADYIKGFTNVEKIELLPYHTMGKNKYKDLDIDYALENTIEMDPKKCKIMEEKLLKLLS